MCINQRGSWEKLVLYKAKGDTEAEQWRLRRKWGVICRETQSMAWAKQAWPAQGLKPGLRETPLAPACRLGPWFRAWSLLSDGVALGCVRSPLVSYRFFSQELLLRPGADCISNPYNSCRNRDFIPHNGLSARKGKTGTNTTLAGVYSIAKQIIWKHSRSLAAWLLCAGTIGEELQILSAILHCGFSESSCALNRPESPSFPHEDVSGFESQTPCRKLSGSFTAFNFTTVWQIQSLSCTGLVWFVLLHPREANGFSWRVYKTIQ